MFTCCWMLNAIFHLVRVLALHEDQVISYYVFAWMGQLSPKVFADGHRRDLVAQRARKQRCGAACLHVQKMLHTTTLTACTVDTAKTDLYRGGAYN
mmetsp:Transcript_8009/g.11921  ORF Transcript_8009/g.11921 Transcript_8009/m.11921 type:complete len:96 (-) Transcript_8009:139-426(-)